MFIAHWEKTVHCSLTKECSVKNELWTLVAQWEPTIHFSFLGEVSLKNEEGLFNSQWLKNIRCERTKEYSPKRWELTIQFSFFIECSPKNERWLFGEEWVVNAHLSFFRECSAKKSFWIVIFRLKKNVQRPYFWNVHFGQFLNGSAWDLSTSQEKDLSTVPAQE